MRYRKFTKRLIDEADKNGGATLNKLTGETPNSGYAVGCENLYTGPFPENKVEEEIAQKIRDSESKIIGAWKTPEGILCIDEVSIEKEENAALFVAKLYHQEAIFDLDNCAEINMNYDLMNRAEKRAKARNRKFINSGYLHSKALALSARVKKRRNHGRT